MMYSELKELKKMEANMKVTSEFSKRINDLLFQAALNEGQLEDFRKSYPTLLSQLGYREVK